MSELEFDRLLIFALLGILTALGAELRRKA